MAAILVTAKLPLYSLAPHFKKNCDIFSIILKIWKYLSKHKSRNNTNFGRVSKWRLCFENGGRQKFLKLSVFHTCLIPIARRLAIHLEDLCEAETTELPSRTSPINRQQTQSGRLLRQSEQSVIDKHNQCRYRCWKFIFWGFIWFLSVPLSSQHSKWVGLPPVPLGSPLQACPSLQAFPPLQAGSPTRRTDVYGRAYRLTFYIVYRHAGL